MKEIYSFEKISAVDVFKKRDVGEVIFSVSLYLTNQWRFDNVQICASLLSCFGSNLKQFLNVCTVV